MDGGGGCSVFHLVLKCVRVRVSALLYLFLLYEFHTPSLPRIRMHAVAEMGLAAHWLYKDEQRRVSGPGGSTSTTSTSSSVSGGSTSHYRTAWLTCLKDWQTEVNARDFVEGMCFCVYFLLSCVFACSPLSLPLACININTRILIPASRDHALSFARSLSHQPPSPSLPVPTLLLLLFHTAVRAEILGRRVSFFLKNGRIHDLPRGATLLDAGFKLHKQIGLHLRLAEVNGLPVSSLGYVVQNGDVLYVVATRNAKPSPSWVRAAHCRTTRGKIRTYFRTKEHGVAEEEGRRLVQALLERNPVLLAKKLGAVPTADDLEKSVKSHTGYASLQEVYFQVALSVEHHETGAMLGRVLGLDPESAHELDLTPLMDRPEEGEEGEKGREEEEEGEELRFSARGEQEPLYLLSHNGRETYRLCPCCRPVDGDPLTGLRTWEEPHGEVTVVHRADKACPVLHAEEEAMLGAVGGEEASSSMVRARRVDVDAEKFNMDDDDGHFPVSVEIRARRQRLYVLSNLVASLEAAEAMLLDAALGGGGSSSSSGVVRMRGSGGGREEGMDNGGKNEEEEDDDTLVIRFLIGVHNLAHVERVLKGFEAVGGVLSATRSDLIGPTRDPRPRGVREHDAHQLGSALEEVLEPEMREEAKAERDYDFSV